MRRRRVVESLFVVESSASTEESVGGAYPGTAAFAASVACNMDFAHKEGNLVEGSSSEATGTAGPQRAARTATVNKAMSRVREDAEC